MSTTNDLVFITQETDKNIDQARKYGKFRVMLRTKDIYTRDGTNYNSVSDKIFGILETEQYGQTDYLLCVGDPIIIGITIHNALKLCNLIRILKWDRVRMEYDVVELRRE